MKASNHRASDELSRMERVKLVACVAVTWHTIIAMNRGNRGWRRGALQQPSIESKQVSKRWLDASCLRGLALHMQPTTFFWFSCLVFSADSIPCYDLSKCSWSC